MALSWNVDADKILDAFSGRLHCFVHQMLTAYLHYTEFFLPSTFGILPLKSAKSLRLAYP